MPVPPFFHATDLPPRLDGVDRDFPFPLALTYVRLLRAFDSQQPVKAVRDGWEAASRFAVCVTARYAVDGQPRQSYAVYASSRRARYTRVRHGVDCTPSYLHSEALP